jgi:DNA-binding MarR family transcriptional regulator
MLDLLLEKGWFERRADGTYWLINRIYMTERGVRILEAMLPIAAATFDVSLADLSRQEQDRLIGVMMRVKANLTRLAEADVISEDFDVEGDAITEARVL